MMNNTNENPPTFVNGFSFGADNQSRTGDLILTKDALYLLSYSSMVLAYGIEPFLPVPQTGVQTSTLRQVYGTDRRT